MMPCGPLWLWESEVHPGGNRKVPGSWEKEKLETWSQLQEELNSHSSGSCQDHLRGETGTEIMICQCRAGPHLDRDCLVIHTSYPPFKPEPRVRGQDPEDGLQGGAHNTCLCLSVCVSLDVCLSSQCQGGGAHQSPALTTLAPPSSLLVSLILLSCLPQTLHGNTQALLFLWVFWGSGRL